MPTNFIPGQKYDVPNLVFSGWTTGDGSGHEGYNAYDYFDRDGRYLGPDQHGIEPIAEVTRGSGVKLGTIISITVDSVWAGSGNLVDGRIENCGAQFCEDNDESLKVYEQIEAGIAGYCPPRPTQAFCP